MFGSLGQFVRSDPLSYTFCLKVEKTISKDFPQYLSNKADTLTVFVFVLKVCDAVYYSFVN